MITEVYMPKNGMDMTEGVLVRWLKQEGERVEVKVNDTYSYFVTIQKIENTKDDDTDRIRSY